MRESTLRASASAASNLFVAPSTSDSASTCSAVSRTLSAGFLPRAHAARAARTSLFPLTLSGDLSISHLTMRLRKSTQARRSYWIVHSLHRARFCRISLERPVRRVLAVRSCLGQLALDAFDEPPSNAEWEVHRFCERETHVVLQEERGFQHRVYEVVCDRLRITG